MHISVLVGILGWQAGPGERAPMGSEDPIDENWLSMPPDHQYPHTRTILGKYDGQHDHPLGDENLRFLRLSHHIRSLVMDMIREGMDAEAIVSQMLIPKLPKLTAFLAKMRP